MIEAADREEVTNPLPAATTEITHDRYCTYLRRRTGVIQPGFHDIQRRRAADRIKRNGVRQATGQCKLQGLQDRQVLVVEIAHAWRNPQIQVHRERYENNDVTRHGRVEDIKAQPAIQVLCDDDGKQGTGRGNPPGCQ